MQIPTAPILPVQVMSESHGRVGWAIDGHEFRSRVAVDLYCWAKAEPNRVKATRIARVSERVERRKSRRKLVLV